MTGTVVIKGAFGTALVARKTVLATHGVQLIVAKGEHLVGVTLMTNIENNGVFGWRKHPEQGDGEIHNPEVGAEVSATFGAKLHNGASQVATQL